MPTVVNPPLLSIEDLSVDFSSAETVSHAVKQVSLQVQRGEILGLVGESGSGKSVTSLSILRLLPQPPAIFSSGRILFYDKDLRHDLLTATPKELQHIRGNRIAMIFQEPMTSLNPVMKCGHQVMEALRAHKTLSKEEARQQALSWLEKVKLPRPETIFHRYPHELSGGQKQRVMIAMAMCCQPALLICDEPTTALDVTVQKTILELIKQLQQENNMGVIFITHDLGVVAGLADRVAIMLKGSIVEEGPTRQIFHQPRHPYTQALIACKPSQHHKGERLPTVADFLGSQTENKKTKASPQGGIKHQTKSVTGKQSLIRVENLVVEFPAEKSFLGKPKSYIRAVDDVSFEIYEKETLGLVGESGCGKTTLGRSLLRLIEPTSGKIVFKYQNLTALDAKTMKGLRRQVQLVFQDPFSSLNPRLTIGSALAEPLQVTGLIKNKHQRREKIADLLQRVNLSPDMMNRYPHEFSGGQRQRIVIARALALDPDFLVCDESVSALDVSVQAQVLNLLNDLKQQLGLTMLFISHDLSVVHHMCQRIMVMKAGRIVETGNADDIYLRPQNDYTKSLIAAIPRL